MTALIPMSDPRPSDTPDYGALIDAARQGDVEARNAAILRVYPKVERLVHSRLQRNFRLKNPWLRPMFSTGDIVQDVFIGVLTTAPKLHGQGEDAVVGYLATAVQNRLLDMMRYHGAARRDARRRVDESPTESDTPTAPAASPFRNAATNEKLSIYLDVLTTFPRRQQELLRRRLEHGQQFQSLALELGFPTADAARKMFHEVHAKLLFRLSTRGVRSDSHDSLDV